LGPFFLINAWRPSATKKQSSDVVTPRMPENYRSRYICESFAKLILKKTHFSACGSPLL
jgi:hypothetical protein